MVRVTRLGFACAAVALSFVFPVRAAHAVWPSDTFAGNLPVCTANGDQSTPVSVSDGAGGAIVAFTDLRSGSTDIYVQHVSAAGQNVWTANGVAVCTAAFTQFTPVIASDGAGGAIIAWADARNAAVYDLYAQRISAAGVPQWTANGVAVCSAGGDQLQPSIVADGAGGAIIAWSDSRSLSTYDIYAQRVNAAGTPQWTANGVAVCTAAGDQAVPVLTTDGLSGCLVAWQDGRGADRDIYCMRLLAGGTSTWFTNGTALCTSTGDQLSPAIVSDGGNGAIVTWQDARGGSTTDIYTQRVNGSGLTQWLFNGLGLCTATGNQSGAVLAPDGFGGAVCAWTDYRSGTADIYTQRLSAGGLVQWAVNGVALCTSIYDQYAAAIASDGANGALVAWQDYRNAAGLDLYAQRVSGVGAAQWAANGVAVSLAAYNQSSPSVVSDGANGMLAVWADGRASGSYDIYAQRVDRYGYLGAEPAITSVRDVLNDQGGKVKVSWNASVLDAAYDANLFAYDIYRSAPSSLAPGAVVVHSFSERVAAGDHAVVQQGNGAQAIAWEYLATVLASHFPAAYSYLAATTGDSVGGSNPYTPFLVVARNYTGTMYWTSAADSGYSVDNLPPAAVTPFSGQYAGGAATLHWGKAGDADFASYRLYRGATASFVPSPSNLVVDQPDTGYVDVIGALDYYKIASVDTHGNVGPYTTVLPSGVVGVGDPHAPAVAALTAYTDRSGATRIAWSVPRSGDVQLTLHSVAGRLVRELARGARAAGTYETAWDGRDAHGAPVAAGVYLARLATAERVLLTRVVCVR